MENDKIEEISNSPEYTILESQLKETFNKLDEIIKLIQSDLDKPLPMDLINKEIPDIPDIQQKEVKQVNNS
jgi:hypothetical protein